MRKNLAQEKSGYKDVVSPINDGKPGARKLDQVISGASATASVQRAPGPGHKPQAPSSKLQAPSVKLSNQPVQASSDKRQALRCKRQA